MYRVAWVFQYARSSILSVPNPRSAQGLQAQEDEHQGRVISRQRLTWSRGFVDPDSKIQDIEFTKTDVFGDATELAERHDLDLSDAFQLLCRPATFHT